MGNKSTKVKTESVSITEAVAELLLTMKMSCASAATGVNNLSIKGSKITGSKINMQMKQNVQCFAQVQDDTEIQNQLKAALDTEAKAKNNGIAINSSVKNEDIARVENYIKTMIKKDTVVALAAHSTLTQNLEIVDSEIGDSEIFMSNSSAVKTVASFLQSSAGKFANETFTTTKSEALDTNPISEAFDTIAGVLTNPFFIIVVGIVAVFVAMKYFGSSGGGGGMMMFFEGLLRPPTMKLEKPVQSYGFY